MNKTKLGKILDVRRGASLSGKYYSTKGDKIRLTLGNFNYPSKGFKENISKTDIYFTGKVRPEFILKKGDIITPLTEQVAGLLGETARIPEDDIYIQSGDIGLVIPNEKVLDKSFTYYLISSPLVKKQLGAAAQQTKIRHTSPDKIKDCEIFLLDIENQKRVGFLLDTINSKIELNNRINAELEAMAKMLYDYWFVQFDFPDANGKPYKSSGGKMVYSKELKREIPEGWEVDKLDRLGTIIGGSTPTTEDECNFCKKTGMPWITPKDLSINKENKFITRGENDVTEKGIANASLSIMPKGTVLLSSRAPIGYLAISRGNVTTNQGFKSFVPDKGYSTAFIYYSIKSLIPIIEKNAVGSTFKEVSAGTLKGIRMVYPDMDVIYSFDKKADHIFRKQDILEFENQQLSSLRDWLLPMLMNGQVKVVDEKEKKVYKMNDEVSMAAEP